MPEDNSKLKIVIVNGPPGAGKTTFEDLCEKYIEPFLYKRSTVDKVKEFALHCGWNGEKDLQGRRFLSDLKDALTRYNDLPLHDIIDFIDDITEELQYYGLNPGLGVLMCDCREPEEIDKLKKKLGAITLLIDRDMPGLVTSNHADANVYNYDYDFYINNCGDLNDLEKDAANFLKTIGIKFENYKNF